MFNELGHKTALADRYTYQGLVRNLARYFDPPIRIVEIGCWVGMTTRHLLNCGVSTEVYVVDHFQGNPEDHLGEIASEIGPESVLHTFLSNVRDSGAIIGKDVRIFQGTSKFWCDAWNLPVHMVILDANHEYESLLEDFNWWRHLIARGVFCGHDYYTEHCPGVKQAVALLDGVSIENCVWYREKQFPNEVLSLRQAGSETASPSGE